MKKKVISLFLLFLIVVISVQIFSFSAQTGEESGSISRKLTEKILDVFGWEDMSVETAHHIVRKLAHFSEYALLGALICLFFLCILKRELGCIRIGAISFVITAMYAATDEFHQLFVPERAGSVGDVLIDSAGALLGVTAVALVRFLVCRAKERSAARKKPTHSTYIDSEKEITH